MNILAKLVELANEFDKKGLYDESAVLDQIIREAAPPDAEVDPMWDKRMGMYLRQEVAKAIGDTSDEVLVNMKADFAKAKGRGLESLMPLLTRYKSRIDMKGSDELKAIEGKYQGWLQKHYKQQQEKAEQGDSIAGETEPKVSPEQAKINENLKRVEQAGKKGRVKAEQQKYNAMRKQLVAKNIMKKEDVKRQFPWLKPDGIPGNQTKKMRNEWRPALQKALEQGIAAQTQQRQQTESYDATQRQEAVLQQQREQELQKAIQSITKAYRQQRLRDPQNTPAGQEAKIEEMMRNMTSAQGGMAVGDAMAAVARHLKI